MEQFDFVNNPGGNLINATNDLTLSAHINNISHAPQLHDSEYSGMGNGGGGAATSIRQMNKEADPQSIEESKGHFLASQLENTPNSQIA